MTVRRPLVLVAGRQKELPSGDTLPTGTVLAVESIVAGTNVTVDATDPRNPIVSASGGGGGGGGGAPDFILQSYGIT